MSHRRTALQRIEVRNFRSIEHLVLEQLPDMVVIHGPAGSGKTNVLRAVRLVLRAAARPHLPGRREDAWVLSAADADAQLGLRPDDFRRGTTELSVALRLSLGTAALAALGIEGLTPTALTLECCAQLAGADQLRVWFPMAETDDGLGLWNSSGSGSLSRIVTTLQNKETQIGKNRSNSKLPEAVEMRLKIEQGLALLAHAPALSERFRLSLLPERLLLTCDAGRRLDHEPTAPEGGAPAGLQARLVQASLSEHEDEGRALARLGQALGRVRLLGDVTPPQVALRPVQSRVFREDRLMVHVPGQGEVPVRQLGLGQQQLVMILGWQILRGCPLLAIEEPESHLDRQLMASLAEFLRASVEPGDERPPLIDQLWLETHHDAFALWPEFFEVSLVQGRTVVHRRSRARAPSAPAPAPAPALEAPAPAPVATPMAMPVPPPGPFWDFLRHLLMKGAQPDDVLFIDRQGQPVTAGILRRAIDRNRPWDSTSHRLAREFLDFASQTLYAPLPRPPSSPAHLPPPTDG